MNTASDRLFPEFTPRRIEGNACPNVECPSSDCPEQMELYGSLMCKARWQAQLAELKW